MKDTNHKDKSSSYTLKAPAKINLFLKILDRRPDGYHEIESLMQKIELFDVLHLAKKGETIALSCPGSTLPEDKENLVYKAAQVFFAETGIDPGVEIVLEKNIPIAAGLGGGSSDAAEVLIGLNDLFDAALDRDRLMDMAQPLGADIPFFVQNCSAAIATGIGDCIQEVEAIKEFWILLVNPGFEVSTKWVYENFPLTSTSNPYILARGRNLQDGFHTSAPGLFEELGNDLETVTISRYPEIGDIKKELKQAGAGASLMSGSGPTVFGIFSQKEDAERCSIQLSKKYGESVFLVRPYIP